MSLPFAIGDAIPGSSADMAGAGYEHPQIVPESTTGALNGSLHPRAPFLSKHSRSGSIKADASPCLGEEGTFESAPLHQTISYKGGFHKRPYVPVPEGEEATDALFAQIVQRSK